ncbi:GrdX family protein [uncultured Anaerococcus sp.]|uniref:GrdX family protein n=1 Tax=uncultured Anaerococcus sp. TaxID=293428 RepID=UPI00261E1187|nr:GrdX family protein [uncultured Anaerococcus sp.]
MDEILKMATGNLTNFYVVFLFGGNVIITNNPMFIDYKNKNFDSLEIAYKDVEALEVLKIGRDYIHQNYKLLTHPLYGNFRPNELFYRTIIIEESDQLDFESLELIENSIFKIENILKNTKKKNATDSILKDYAYIDFQIMKENMEGGLRNV